MQLKISHITSFTYTRQVQPLLHLAYLRPQENPLLQVHSFKLECTPSAKLYWMRDDFDNSPATIQFSVAASTLKVHSECTVSTCDTPPFDFLVRDYARQFPFSYEPLHTFNLGIYLAPPDSETQAVMKRWLNKHFSDQPVDSVEWLFGLNAALHRSLRYQRRDTAGMQTSVETVQRGTGTCRDYAILLIDLLRTQGIAARFVSGYLYDPHRDGFGGGDMHAWTEVFLPGAGWRGLDPTNGIFCDGAYVRVAHAVLAESVNPLQGSFVSREPVSTQLATDVRVSRT